MSDYLTFQADLSSPDTVSVYDELPIWSAMFGLMLLRHIEMRRNIKLLDIGCGTGFPMLELAQRLGSTCSVYGIDPWEPAVDRARLKMQVWNIRNVEISLGDAGTMPFSDGQFDLIVSNLGLNNFRDPESAMRECWRVLRPNARLVLTTSIKGHMKEFYEVFEATLIQTGNRNALDALTEHIDRRSTVEGIRELFEKTGFTLSRAHEESAMMRFADGSAFLRHYFIKLGFLEGWRNVIDFLEEDAFFSLLEANLNRVAEASGSLNLTIPMVYVEAERVS